MVKTLTAVALVGAMSVAAMPGVAFAQSAAGPEPMQGATPQDNAGSGGAMSKGSDDQGGMSKSSMSKSSMSKHKKHMKHSKKSM